MRAREEGARRGAPSTIISSRTGYEEGTCTAVADGVRVALHVAGIDLAPLGIRAEGRLDWSPAPVPPDGPPEPPVAVARRRVLTRRRLDDLDARRRAARWFAERRAS